MLKLSLVVAIGNQLIGFFGLLLLIAYWYAYQPASIGLGLSLTPSLGHDDMYDANMLVMIFDHFRPRQKC